MRTKILSLGAMYLDINALHFPLQNGLQLNKEIVGGTYEIVPGGSALNFARICASLSFQPLFIGKIGTDSIGEQLVEKIKLASIEPYLIKDTQVTTNISVNYTSDEGTTIMSVLGTANQSLKSEEVLQQVVETEIANAFVYLGGCFKLHALIDTYHDIAEYALQKNNLIIVDHGRINNTVTPAQRKTIKKLITLAHFYLPSKDEFLDLWEVDSIEQGMRKVQDETEAKIVVKDGENGVFGWNDGEIYHVPSFPVTVTNLVGAGDSFNAGFIYAYANSLDFATCLRFGNATAALKISTNKLPTIEDIKAIL